MKEESYMYNSAIIGCGRIFSTHADAIQKSGYAKIRMVVDNDEGKAASASLRYKCEYGTDYKNALKRNDIDVVHICTPHYLHAQMAIDAMLSGKDVLVEKPMAISANDAEKMIITSEETERKIGVCFQNRYNPASLWVKQFLDSGRAGKILSARVFFTWSRDVEYYESAAWRGTWSMEGGGVLINQAIHTLDLLQWFMGDVDWVKASIDTRLLNDCIEVEDTADVTIRFKTGAYGSFYATNNYTLDSPPLLEFHCEKAVIRLEDNITITYTDNRKEIITNLEENTGEKTYWGLSHEKLIREFYKNLSEKKQFFLDGNQGITATKLVDAIYQSSSTDKLVKL